VIPDHPLADLAIGALIALIVLILTPGLAIAAVVSLAVFAGIGLWAVRRRAWGNARRRGAGARARRRAR
jgi:hypothetical protein